MDICPIRAEEVAGFVAFLDAGMRPDGAVTSVVDDFPVILSARNRVGMLGIRQDSDWIAGLAALSRTFLTSAGPLVIAGIGSVVTHPDHRGRGLSRQLQIALLERLRHAGAALAVLWTDQPEIYARRGFVPAGWEFHVDLTGLEVPSSWPPGAEVRSLGGDAADDLGALYEQHAWRTVRGPGDHRALYGMPGTSIVGLWRGGQLRAFACCGKGADFPDYVAEWGGDPGDLVPLLARVHADGLATRVLVPAGGEALLERLAQLGAGFAVVPCGLWCVLRPDLLTAACGQTPAVPEDARTWLGTVDARGEAQPGPIRVAVWGFDSV